MSIPMVNDMKNSFSSTTNLYESKMAAKMVSGIRFPGGLHRRACLGVFDDDFLSMWPNMFYFPLTTLDFYPLMVGFPRL